MLTGVIYLPVILEKISPGFLKKKKFKQFNETNLEENIMRKIFRQKENPINIMPKFNSIQLNFDCDNDNMVKLNFDELKSQVKYSLNEVFDVDLMTVEGFSM